MSYLYGAALRESVPRPRNKANESYMSKTIGAELITSAMARVQLKDTMSSKLGVMGPRQAEASTKAELRYLHKQINALPEALREETRMNYLLDQNIKRKDSQDFQCVMMGKIEAILRARIIANGGDYLKYRIGGFDNGTYERFFRVEPSRFMSKAQLVTALRRSFGDDVITSEASISRLFDSFDFQNTDKMDWRACLYLLMLLMQSYHSGDVLLRWAYAIYTSVGTLDLDCTDKLKLGIIKDMICTPVLLSKQSALRHQFDSAWYHLSGTESEVIQFTALKSSVVADPDDLKIPYRILMKIFSDTPFGQLLDVATVFGKRDTRQWTNRLEEEYYHPIMLQSIKQRRRDTRNDNEAKQFIALSNKRCKIMYMALWKRYVARRNFLRIVIIGSELRTNMGLFGLYYDHWKKLTIQIHSAELLQKWIRGFLGRRRKRFVRRIQAKVTKVQSGARQLMTRLKYNLKRSKLHYAAITIQRVVRGRISRRRVASLVRAYYDTQKRLFEREKESWYLLRRIKAAVKVQMYIRRFILRCRRMKQMEQREKIEEIEFQQAKEAEKQRVDIEVYRKNLTQWYVDRKRQYDETMLTEKHTAAQKKLILARKSKKADELKALQKQQREEQFEKVQEVFIENWIKRWEEKIIERGDKRREQCRNCLQVPETPEEIQLKKDLQKRIKKNLKEVLRSADRQKIPMELPEAFEISTTEMIEQEVENEMERARAEMKVEATLRQQEEDKKKQAEADFEKAEKRRKRRWALLTIQSYSRVFLARKRKRAKAYKRYKKHFDPIAHEYYYEDVRTKKSVWVKPPSLGSYDLDMENNWMVIQDKHSDGQFYYYNPCTWEQTWDQPLGTVLCNACNRDFAVCLFLLDNNSYCGTCFTTLAVQHVNDFGMDPKEIRFKPFAGNTTDSEYVDFYYIPETNWQLYLLDLGCDLKQSEEDEIRDAIASEKRQKISELRKKKLQKLQLCTECKRNNKKSKTEATINCYECGRIFCDSCFTIIHRHQTENPSLAAHIPTKLEFDKYIKLPDIFATSSTLAICDVGGSPPGTADGTKKNTKKKKKKKRTATKVSSKTDDSDGNTDAVDEDGTHSRAVSSDVTFPADTGTRPMKKKKKKTTAKDTGAAVVAVPSDADNDNKEITAVVAAGVGYITDSSLDASSTASGQKKKKKKKKVTAKSLKNTADGDSSLPVLVATKDQNNSRFKGDVINSHPCTVYSDMDAEVDAATAAVVMKKMKKVQKPATAPALTYNNSTGVLSGYSDADTPFSILSDNNDLPVVSTTPKPKKKKTTKGTTSAVGERDGDDDQGTPSSGVDGGKKKKLKTKTKRPKTADGSSVADGPLLSEDGTAPSKVKKKKKKSTSAEGMLSESEFSVMSDDTGNPKKKKKSTKKKKTGDESGVEDSELSGFESTSGSGGVVVGVKKKKKKKVASNVDIKAEGM